MSLYEVPAPDLDDARFAPYWSGAAAHKIMLPECEACGTVNWPPRRRCLRCRAREFAWREHRPAGRLFSWIVVGHPTAPGYLKVPYAVGIVTLDDSEVRLMGGLMGLDADDIEMGMPLIAHFAPAGDETEFTLIQWRPAKEKS